MRLIKQIGSLFPSQKGGAPGEYSWIQLSNNK